MVANGGVEFERDGGILSIAGEAEGSHAVLDSSHTEDEIPFFAWIKIGHGGGHDDISIARDTALEVVEDVDAVPLKVSSAHAGFNRAVLCDTEGGGHFNCHGMKVGLHVFVEGLDLRSGLGKFAECLEVNDISPPPAPGMLGRELRNWR